MSLVLDDLTIHSQDETPLATELRVLEVEKDTSGSLEIAMMPGCLQC